MADRAGASERLARQLAHDLGIDDWPRVEEGRLFSRHENVSGALYELPRDAIEADLAHQGRGLGRGRLGGRG